MPRVLQVHKDQIIGIMWIGMSETESVPHITLCIDCHKMMHFIDILVMKHFIVILVVKLKHFIVNLVILINKIAD